ncbi:MAG: M28 family peptidase, partial [Acidobacteria bacterium]|nr:M28 family peptidase [Acidobacteriota bacterium]
MKRIFLVGLLFAVAMMGSHSASLAQRKAAKPKARVTKAASISESGKAGEFGNVEAITGAKLKDYLYFVASDEMEGRSTPSRGLDLTAKFIALNLKRWGLKPGGTDGTFFQKFGLQQRQLLPEKTSVSVNGQSFKIGEDFMAQPYAGTAAGQLVYVGHGKVVKSKNINPYQGIDVKDKIMLVADGYPKGVTYLDFQNGKAGVDYDLPDTYARAHGARGIIVLPGPSVLSFWDQRYKSSLKMTPLVPEHVLRSSRVPAIMVSEKMANAILQGEKLDYAAISKQIADSEFSESFDLSSNKEVKISVGALVETILTQNVVAVLEGSHPVLKDEYVAIGAHYDHIGNSPESDCRPIDGDRICNGADDDGSGTVAVLAIAEALAHGPRPERSI